VKRLGIVVLLLDDDMMVVVLLLLRLGCGLDGNVKSLKTEKINKIK
jgi:hypothetical protein